MIEKVITILASLAEPLGRFLNFIVGLFKKPLVQKEQDIAKDNQTAKDKFEKDGRPS